MDTDNQEQAQNHAWVAGWRQTAAVLEALRTRELRALTEEEAGQRFADMAADPDTLWISPERAGAAGLIEQQRLFLCSHEHPSRHCRRP